MVAGLDAVPLCTTPTPPPSSAAWPLGAAAQAAALHSKPRGVAQATPHRGMAGGGLVFLEIDEAEHKFYSIRTVTTNVTFSLAWLKLLGLTVRVAPPWHVCRQDRRFSPGRLQREWRARVLGESPNPGGAGFVQTPSSPSSTASPSSQLMHPSAPATPSTRCGHLRAARRRRPHLPRGDAQS